MFREIQSVTFEIQTVGRILRMPEAKHYDDDDELNRAYVYTNLSEIHIGQDNDSKSFFKIRPSHRKQNYIPVNLPSVYLRQIDYGDFSLFLLGNCLSMKRTNISR